MKVAVGAISAVIVAALFLGTVSGSAEAQAIPPGPWVDRLVWSEQPEQADPGLAAELIRIDQADFLMGSFKEGQQKQTALRSADLLTSSTHGEVVGLVFNPNEQQVGVPWNPFTDSRIREAMQWLIDRDLLVHEILDGFAIPYVVPFHPKSADYARELETMSFLEKAYGHDFSRARDAIESGMVANGASIGPSGFWEDSTGKVIDLQIIARIEDERGDVGNYVAQQLRRLGFEVTLHLKPFKDLGVIFGDPDVGAWHVFTEGWAFTASRAWDDGLLWFFHDCLFEPFCARYGPPATYSTPTDFDRLAEDLASGKYTSLAERQAWVRELTPQALSEANYRMWLYAEQAVFPANDRLEGYVTDAFGGPLSMFTLKTARLLPGEPGVHVETGVGGSLHILNPIMLADSWEPFRCCPSIYDSVQVWALSDPGMWIHPHTGRWIDYRAEHLVETAGPDPLDALSVPTDAMIWNVSQAQFVQVGPNVTARSSVTTKLTNPGKWHTGMAIATSDLVYALSNAYRRAFGDISEHDSWASDAGVEFFLNEILKGVRVVDDETIEAYIDVWHVDDAEIAHQGDLYMVFSEIPVPWEIMEVASQTLIEETLAIDPTRATTELDLGRNPRSIAALDAAFDTIQAENDGRGRIPQGMGPWITQAEAAARYAAAKDFRDTHGHWYASNGPFKLERIDPALKQTVMAAFREGYPFSADHWDQLKVRQVAEVSFGTFPSSLLAGKGQTLEFWSTVSGRPSDPATTSWFLRELARGSVVLRGTPARLGVGEFEVQLLSTETIGLESGAFELVVIVQGVQGSAFRSFPFTVQSQLDWVQALLSQLEDRLDVLSDQTSTVRDDVQSVQVASGGLQGLVTLVLLLTVVAIGVSVGMILLVLSRLRSSGSRPQP